MIITPITNSHYPILLLLFCSLTLTSCDFRAPQNCSTVYQDRPDLLSGFSLEDNGLANKSGTPVFWSRCPAGMQYTNPNNCSGIPLFFSFDQARIYATEISEKSSQIIRLPTINEMQNITETSCINPSLNTNVFPAASVDKFWTSEQHSFRDELACTFYTYQGMDSCLELKSTEYPFLLVIERDGF